MSSDNKNAMLQGDRLREAREYLGLSLDFVAANMRWQASYLQALEQGDCLPDAQELAGLARLYCCDSTSLTGMGDD